MLKSENSTLTVKQDDVWARVELPALRVRVTAPGRSPREAQLGLEPLSVGSHEDAGLVCEDVKVSRKHLELLLTRDGVLLRDCHSRNGTFVSGHRVLEVFITPLSTVTLGETQLTLFFSGAPQVFRLSAGNSFGTAQGSSVSMRVLFEQLERAAKTDAALLLWGESGTGKDLLARGVHEQSPRAERPFVVFDCGAVSPELLESILFGHEPGAFSGAVEAQAGLLEQADGGTLFLDEVGDLPLPLQGHVLRALESKSVLRLGGSTPRGCDVRLISATHRDLRRAMGEGKFRKELFFRLAGVELFVPPLRQRKEDIPLLVQTLLARSVPPREATALPSNALRLLASYDWPGNVRELKNTVERMVLFPELSAASVLAPPQSAFPHVSLREAKEAAAHACERAYLIEKLRENGFNVSATARALAMSRQFLTHLMGRHDLRVRELKR